MTFRLLIQERKKLNVPIPPDIIAFKKARWLQHEKELDIIQGQFRVKLLKLQKMLISYKSGNPDDVNHGPAQQTKKIKKKVQVITNINKSIQLDKLIETEMDRQSNKYDFNAVLTQNQVKLIRDQSLVNYMDIILQNLKKSIEDKASILDQQRSTEKHNLEDYYYQLDELAIYRSRAHIIEQAVEGMFYPKAQQDQGFIDDQQDLLSIKLFGQHQDQDQDQEQDMDFGTIQSENTLKLIQSNKEEQETHRQKLISYSQFQQRIENTVQREQKKMGVFVKKKPILTMEELNVYIKQCRQQALVPLTNYQQKVVKKKRQINPSNVDQIKEQLSPIKEQMYPVQLQLSPLRDTKIPFMRHHTSSAFSSPKVGRVYTQYTAAMPKLDGQCSNPQNPGQATIIQLIKKCNSMHTGCNNINKDVHKQIRRQNVQMNRLDKRIDTINFNFLENKMILI